MHSTQPAKPSVKTMGIFLSTAALSQIRFPEAMRDVFASSQLHRAVVFRRGTEASFHHALCLPRHVQPAFVERAGADLIGEIAEQVCLLRGRMIVAVLYDGDFSPAGFHTLWTVF